MRRNGGLRLRLTHPTIPRQDATAREHYGPVKENAAEESQARHTQLIADLANPPPAPRQIAAE